MRAEQVMSAIRPLVTAGIVPGAVVGISHRGEKTLEVAGTTEPGGSDPLTAGAPVRISSNTKPMIAALTAQDGALALEDPVERFLPELAD